VRTTWLAIAASAALLCWAVGGPRLASPGKPPPPPQCPPYCPDEQDAGPDAGVVVVTEPDGAPVETSDGAATVQDDAPTGASEGSVELLKGGCGCRVTKPSSDARAGIAGLALVAALAYRRRRAS
jgi:MYXO-CTERM domain-containing protein